MQSALARAFMSERPVEESPELREIAERYVSPKAHLTSAEQVDIYRRQYWMRHIEALDEDYPGVRYIIGDDAWERFARGYLESFPPREPSLRDLGNDTLTFAGDGALFEPSVRAVALDMLRYERAFVDVFDGPTLAPLDASKLAHMPSEAWATARLVLSPIALPLMFSSPVNRLRIAIRAGEAPSVEAHLASARPEGHPLVLFRVSNIVSFEELSPSAYALLSALKEGIPLLAACEKVISSADPSEAKSIAENVRGWFETWGRHGIITDIVS